VIDLYETIAKAAAARAPHPAASHLVFLAGVLISGRE